MSAIETRHSNRIIYCCVKFLFVHLLFTSFTIAVPCHAMLCRSFGLEFLPFVIAHTVCTLYTNRRHHNLNLNICRYLELFFSSDAWKCVCVEWRQQTHIPNFKHMFSFKLRFWFVCVLGKLSCHVYSFFSSTI